MDFKIHTFQNKIKFDLLRSEGLSVKKVLSFHCVRFETLTPISGHEPKNEILKSDF